MTAYWNPRPRAGFVLVRKDPERGNFIVSGGNIDLTPGDRVFIVDESEMYKYSGDLYIAREDQIALVLSDPPKARIYSAYELATDDVPDDPTLPCGEGL
jgi:hypothetical protein